MAACRCCHACRGLSFPSCDAVRVVRPTHRQHCGCSPRSPHPLVGWRLQQLGQRPPAALSLQPPQGLPHAGALSLRRRRCRSDSHTRVPATHATSLPAALLARCVLISNYTERRIVQREKCAERGCRAGRVGVHTRAAAAEEEARVAHRETGQRGERGRPGISGSSSMLKPGHQGSTMPIF